MGVGFDKDVRRLLKEDGWDALPGKRGKGSHEIWEHPNKSVRITVPKNIKSRHTANAILKEAGVNTKL